MPSSLRRTSVLMGLVLWLGLAAPPELAAQRDYQFSSFSPTEVSYLGSTPFVILGSGFNPGIEVRIGSEVVTTTRIDATRLEGLVPATAARNIGTTPDVTTDDPVSGRIVKMDAFRYAGPFKLVSVAIARGGPSLPAGVGGDIILRGTGFSPLTSVLVGATRVADRFIQHVSPAEIRCQAPGLDSGTYNVTVEDFEGVGRTTRVFSVLPNALVYAGDIAITSFEPPILSYLGKTLFAIRGRGFSNLSVVSLAGAAVPPALITSISPTEIRGVAPAYSGAQVNTPLTASVADRVQGVAALRDAFTYASPLLARSVELEGGKSALPEEEGGQVTLLGRAFTPETSVDIVRTRAGAPPTVVAAIESPDVLSATTIVFSAPPLPEGLYGVRVSDRAASTSPLIQHTLPEAIAYEGTVVEPPPEEILPGPQEIEATLAEGTARFKWYNPVPYSSILVRDLDTGATVVLPGNATLLEIPSGARDSMKLELKGEVEASVVKPSLAWAKLHECERPPSLVGWGQTTILAPDAVNWAKFSLKGGHAAALVSRCSGGGGGALAGDLARGGGADARGGGAALNGVPQAAGSIGYIVPQIVKSQIIDIDSPRRLTTGFVLEKPASKLEIAFLYEKHATEFGLSLRGRLRRVYPAQDFADELTFPDVIIDNGKKLNPITYYRADRDVGGPIHPDDPSTYPVPCGLDIPAGEYLLDVYAVGGNPNVPYYEFVEDETVGEILIAGAPCPPYPLVRVHDLTGLRTIPDILSIQATPHVGVDCSPGTLNVTFQAYGSWTDENDNVHPVPAAVSNDVNPDFEYRWKIHDRTYTSYKNSQAESSVNACLSDWGCFKVELTILDKACGTSVTRAFEVPVVPPRNALDCSTLGPYYSFLFPTPDPKGLTAILGLNTTPPPGNGKFEGKRPLELRVLVMPSCYCCNNANPATCPPLSTCPAPSIGSATTPPSVEFRLARMVPFGTEVIQGVDIEVLDLCPNVTQGAKYFLVSIDDLGEIPAQDFLTGSEFRNVRLQGRTLRYGSQSIPGGAGNPWLDVGTPMKFSNYPEALDGNGAGGVFWSGTYNEKEDAYHFIVKTNAAVITSFELGDTKSIDILGVAEIPAYPDNESSSGFISRFMAMRGEWSAEPSDGTMTGDVLGNDIEGAPLRVEPSGGGGGAAGGDADPAGGGAALLPHFDWCDHRTLFENNFSQTLFEALLYTGTIGPVPVSIWASIGLGLEFLVESQVAVGVSPFAPRQHFGQGPASFAEAHFALCSSVRISVPCEVRADILGGVGSIAVRLIPDATMDLNTDLGVRDSTPTSQHYVGAFFSLVMEVEACINLILGEVCTPDIPIELVEPTALLEVGADFEVAKCPSQGDEPVCEGLAGGGAGSLPAPGSGGPVYQTIIEPSITYSPDHGASILAYVDEAGVSQVYVYSPEFPLEIGGLPASHQGVTVLDPAVTFVSNDAAIVAWTRLHRHPDAPAELPSDIDDPATYLPWRNRNASQLEVVISAVTLPVVDWKDPIRIADEPGLPLDDGRADGRAAIAADLDAGEAIVAWVRYESPDFLIVDPLEPTKVLALPCSQTRGCVPPPGGVQVPGKPYYKKSHVNYQHNMTSTAIYARRVGLTGAIGPKQKISATGINIEPTVAISPSGQSAYCVWVNDSIHRNLIDSNQGRQLHYSFYDRDLDAWEPPVEVLAIPEDYPAVLEPAVALRGDGSNGRGKGILAFTAIKKGSPLRDTGLGGGSRFVYVCHIEDGVFGEPRLVHGKCLEEVHGHWVKPMPVKIPNWVEDNLKLNIPTPDWVMVFQGHGPSGLPGGSGGVLVSTMNAGELDFGPPIRLTPENQIVSNVAGALAGGNLVTIHLNGGPSSLSPGAGAGGGGQQVSSAYEIIETPLEPDPAIGACKLSFQFPAPGSRETATVTVTNNGLGGTPVDDAGASGVGLQAVFIDHRGEERIVAAAAVPPILPGGSADVVLHLEMPHDPVQLRVQLHPNPVDRDLTNNWRVCPFGAPAPFDLACVPTILSDEDASLAAVLTWRNAGLYDQVIVYRDGTSVASLPGTSTRFVDNDALEGVHTYEVRGGVFASSSVRVPVTCQVSPPSPGTQFRRGDTDSNGRLELSDAVVIINFLFLGGRAPACMDAADSDDSGGLNITDAIRILGYLFLGAAPPLPPGPLDCGEDPTDDSLGCAATAVSCG